MGIDEPPPELDERTAFWVRAFNILCRTRPQGMSGILPLSPVVMLDMSERLDWPCDPQECIEVLTAMDDEYREMHNENK